jgi:phospholipid/cholesterol/gamma-HCH transport system substrate-binding protein
MASVEKIKWAKLKVGGMAIFALLIIGYLIFLMQGTAGFFKGKSDIYTFMDDSQGMATGVNVTLNGLNVGKVAKVELSGSSQPGRIVRITLEIDEDKINAIPSDSTTELASSNLLGDKYINIKKGKSSVSVKPGGELPSSETAELEDVFRQASSTLAVAQTIIKRLDAIVSEVELGKGNLGKIIQDETLYNNAVDLTNQFKQIAAEIKTTLDTTLNSNDNSVGKLLHDNGAMYDDVRASTMHLNSILSDVDSGKGTVGKLFKSDQLANDAHKLMAEDLTQTLSDARKLLASIDTKSGDLTTQIQGAIGKLDTLLDKINNGNGTVARLLNDQTTAEDLDGVMRETQGLLKDFRANPKKFLRIELKLF